MIIGSVGSSKEDFDEAIATLPSLDVIGIIEKVLPLSQFEKAWELVKMRKHLKVLLQL